jgi:hypothetical protein
LQLYCINFSKFSWKLDFQSTIINCLHKLCGTDNQLCRPYTFDSDSDWVWRQQKIVVTPLPDLCRLNNIVCTSTNTLKC